MIDDITEASSYDVEIELADGEYNWTVGVVRDSETEHWSDTSTFHLSLVVVTSVPLDGAIINDTRIFFDWFNFPQSNGYRIIVWPEDSPESPVFDNTTFTSSEKANTTFFEGDYCWTVGTRYAEETEFGRFSDTLCFSVDQYPYYLTDTTHTRAEPRVILPYFDALFVGDGSAGLLICDRSDPEHPTVVSWDEPVGQDVNRALWADPTREILAVSDYRGTHPILFYNIESPLSPYWSDWSGIWGRKNQDVDGIWFRDTLFVAIADYDDGAILFDLSDTVYQSVNTRGNLQPEGYTYGVALDDSLLFVAAGQRGLYISRILEPSEIVGWVDTPGEAEKIAIAGNYCFVADGIAGLTVVDFSDIEDPAIVGRDNPQVGNAQRISIQGDYAFVAYGSGGTKIYDISDPTMPVIIQEIDGMYSYCATPDGDILYIADRDWGVVTLTR